MINHLTGYNVLEQLYLGDKIIVSRAVRKVDNHTVILKMLKAEYPDPHDIARLSYEYDLLKQFSIPEMIRTFAFEKQQNRFALVLENVPNSMTLRSYLHNYKLDLVGFLRMAIQMADALDKIHEAGIIHKDVNPDNMLVIGNGEAIKILDLSLATQLQEEQHGILNSECLEGTLPYISPEQTTRMNRPIDRRTDLYSLGITFYEMLVGHLPFHAKDAIEWVHCHIAKRPVAPHTLDTSIPEMVSRIILKLLAKSAEDRYETAYGLKTDLETALIAWQKNHHIPIFEVGTNDRKGIFHIPQKLYGREAEIQKLMEVFQAVSNGERELLLIAGYTGIGKTSLINEIQKSIVKQHGYFSSGKYETYNREVPYAGLIQAFRDLINQILTGNKQRIEKWRADILNVISPNAQVIINVIPELEKLLGKQPPVIELPPAESRTRFEMVFFDFVSLFAKKEHPLVIFVDDLQWADVGSFNLITQLLKNLDLKYFLLLGAYRDNEVNATHPLMSMLENLSKDNVRHNQIQLKPLSATHLKQLVSDTLHTTKGIESLTDLIMEKTAGNPYFFNLFLTTLYKTQQLKFDQVHDWIFDIDAIKKSPITDNVAELVISEIGKLSPDTQELLRFSACIGTEFDLESLMELTGKNAEEITALLWPALKEKWIIQLGESYKHITKTFAYDNQITIHYRFSHDNVMLTLYSVTDSETRKAIHYKLGKSLLKNYDKDHEEKLFIIAQHFSACLDLIQDPAEKIAIASIFHHAADQMKLSISYDMAIKHYEYALQLLGADIWERDYKLALNIHNSLAISHYLIGSFEKADTLFSEIILKTKTPLDKANVINSRILSYTVQAQHPKAISACEEGLRILGQKIPKNPGKFLLLMTMLKIKWQLRNKKINDLLSLPVMQDPNKILIMELLEKLANTSYIAYPGKFNKPAYAIMLAVLYSIKYGNHTNSSICYTLLGQIEVVRGYIERGYQFAELGIKLCERFQNVNLPIVYLVAIIRILTWKMPYKEIINNANKTFELSYEAGQMYCHQYIATTIISAMQLANFPVSEINKKVKAFLGDHQVTCNNDVYLFLKAFDNYTNVIRGVISLSDYQAAVDDIARESEKRAPVLGALGQKLLRLSLANVVEDWSTALQIISETEKSFLSKPLNTMMTAPSYYFNYALTLLSVYRQASFSQRIHYRKGLNKVLAQLKIWQSHCPVNFAALYYLIKAGIAAEVNDNMDQALIDYELSLASSRAGDRVLTQAIAHEFIARCYLRRKQPRNAIGYIQAAFAAYQQAEYILKVDLLKNRFPELLNTSELVAKTQTNHHSTTVLDMDTVLKSAQTISSQMKLEKLLETLIELVMENAGAERGILLLMENHKLIVEAEGKIDSKPIVLQKEPLELRTDLALSVVHYVQNTQESIILGKAKESGAYTEDPYIFEKNSSSILCAPILYKNYLFGILYLENNLVCDAFTQKHLELLNVLSSQIAISLENARLYSAYDQFIPHEFLDILGKHSIIDICLGDNVQKEMSVLFTDIRGFSKLSEQLGPQEIFTFMNNYLGHMAPIIKKHGGFIDKFIGDAIMALFAGDVSSAISAGIDMQKELHRFNQELIDQGKQPIAIGIGVNSGFLTLGTLGGLNRIETSVLSDAVNVAERIQELTKKYDCRLLISGTAYQKLNNPTHFDMRFIERTTVRGKDENIDIWEVFSGDPDELRYAKIAVAKHYNEAIEHFLNQSYQKALNLFQRCLSSLPHDKVILKYIKNCQKLLGKG